jgi:F-type H+-transporting ATPase subunit gamma
MANTRQIKKRVKSVRNIGKITKALEMASAAKVAAAQDRALSAKPFAQKIYEIVNRLPIEVLKSQVPILRRPEQRQKALVILISSDRGLAGSLNTNLFRFLANYLNEQMFSDIEFITIGKKGIPFTLAHGKLKEDYSESVNIIADVSAIIGSAAENFVGGMYDTVTIVFNDFVNALKQNPQVLEILPIATYAENISGVVNFEPDEVEVLKEIIPYYLEVQLTRCIIEGQASEHAARMIAMKNASDNAGDLSAGLELLYNKERQSAITTEINDIVTAGLTLK